MHRPFHKMPLNAFSISYLYALANGDKDDNQELEEFDKRSRFRIRRNKKRTERKTRFECHFFKQILIKIYFHKTSKALKALNKIETPQG